MDKIHIDKIKKIIKDKAHGTEFYNRVMFETLIMEVDNLVNKFEIDANSKTKDILRIINNYVKSNTSIRGEYFDKFSGNVEFFDEDEKIYRTAYAALLRKQAMCAGYAELTRILLAMYDINSYTLLAKLPGKNKKLMHYVVLAEVNENNKVSYVILDPEREASCERKGMDFKRYLNNMTFAIPNELWKENKIGHTGVGIEAEQFLETTNQNEISDFNSVYRLVKILKERENDEWKGER